MKGSSRPVKIQALPSKALTYGSRASGSSQLYQSLIASMASAADMPAWMEPKSL